MITTYKKQRENNMGEYECVDCNEMFWVDEPPEEKDICEKCKGENNE